MRTVQAQLAYRAQCELGEGSLWDEAERRLFWVDIARSKVFCFDPSTGSNLEYDIGQNVGTVVLSRNGKLLLALRSGFAVFDRETSELKTLGDPEADNPNTRFNDGKCDPRGRFWAGTMVEGGPAAAGGLYCLSTDLSIKKKLSNVSISNGLVWTRDERSFYYIDTPTHEIQAFDYDPETGEIEPRRSVARFESGLGAPDGMTIDEHDQLWVALFGGHKVVRVDPATGDINFQVELPAKNVTSCAFGGSDLDELFVTTARVGTDEETLRALPLAGSLFVAKLPFRGVPAPRFARDL